MYESKVLGPGCTNCVRMEKLVREVLDENGQEYFRHAGFVPPEELVEVLKQKGVR